MVSVQRIWLLPQFETEHGTLRALLTKKKFACCFLLPRHVSSHSTVRARHLEHNVAWAGELLARGLVVGSCAVSTAQQPDASHWLQAATRCACALTRTQSFGRVAFFCCVRPGSNAACPRAALPHSTPSLARVALSEWHAWSALASFCERPSSFRKRL